ncbi:TlpA family protein disulfide reductase [Sphingobium limneticum]|jgi:thiol-disulfide isomerase/thioredoxin|uniref:TlpA family protein disulfide reductase n=1 Tax=Sphingobium TaxID=165695 RepID=UPI00123D2F06|nr:TlpA disulfide reductase family protein [Sphingobium limneticum]KAA9016205.1 TlpA family protein disulfide reductase [Sphingobium limneticum]MBU0933630.1 TlpA family protein disulfide reductase [Alphaproteobacteria bacterium]
MILLLPAALAACDRQSPPKEQANAAISGEVATSSEEVKGIGSKDGTFDYRLDRSKAGTPAPDFAFLDPDGGKKTLKDFAGKPLIVNLWATWCAPCIAEMPTLDRIAATYGPKGLTVLTISQDNQGLKAAKPFFEKHPLPHLKGWADPENHLGFHYATGLLPTTVIYDAQGKEMVRVIGAMDWEGAEAKALIDAAIKS